MRSLQLQRRGFSLLEVVIAVGLLAVVTASFMASIIFTARTAASAKTDAYGIDTINRTIENLRSVTFANLGTTTGDGAQFMTTQVNHMDPDNPTQSPTVSVKCQFMGFGSVASATNTALTAVFPANFPAWTTNQWAGRMVMIKTGVARGQVAFVKSNTADTLTITTTLDGSSSANWFLNPAAGDTFEIDNGKGVLITISWSDREGNHTLTRTTLIPDAT